MSDFQETCNGPYLIEVAGTQFVCVQLTRNSTSGAELHVLNARSPASQDKIGTVQFKGASTPVFA